MNYRQLGRTGLMVSEIGLGGEWLERKSTEQVKEVIAACEKEGINILDCWMSNPDVRSNIGLAIKGHREKWYIQGQIGSIWENGQYRKTRDMKLVKPAFEDLLTRMQTDYMDLGIIHFVDDPDEFESIMSGEFIEYVRELHKNGIIKHIGLSTHNPVVGKMAVKTGEIEMILFSINAAFDMLPPNKDFMLMFADKYDDSLGGINPERAEFYKMCEENGVGLTVMKGYAGGRLFDAKRSPFGVALTPVQCIHYALTRPAVASILVGYDNPQHVKDAVTYETATDAEKDYASVIANAPKHGYTSGQCTYCGHCAPCPSGIDIAMVNKLADLALMQSETPATLKAHYSDLKVNASACVGCSACEKRCPFGVKIAERMKEAVKLFQ